MKIKLGLLIAFILLLLAALNWNMFFPNRQQSTGESESADLAMSASDQEMMLPGFPIDEIPFYQVIQVSSIKFFVNDDPTHFGTYLERPVNYYNVVFESEAGPEETLAYYRSLMSEVNQEELPVEQVQGKIGKYKLSASHYGENPENYVYLEVFLPQDEFQKENRFFDDYPAVVEIDPNWNEYESSFGYLNQKGGEIEYTQYFDFPENEDEIIASYLEKYQDKTEFNYNEESGLMTWQDGENKVYLTFSKDHGRIYLMMRQPRVKK